MAGAVGWRVHRGAITANETWGSIACGDKIGVNYWKLAQESANFSQVAALGECADVGVCCFGVHVAARFERDGAVRFRWTARAPSSVAGRRSSRAWIAVLPGLLLGSRGSTVDRSWFAGSYQLRSETARQAFGWCFREGVITIE